MERVVVIFTVIFITAFGLSLSSAYLLWSQGVEQSSQTASSNLIQEVRQISREQAQAWLFDYALRAAPMTLSFLILIFGGLGAGLIGWAKRTISTGINDAVDRMQREIYASVAACQCLVVWRQDKIRGTLENINEVISLSEDALRRLRPSDSMYWTTVNNLAYFCAESGLAVYGAKAAHFARMLKEQFLYYKKDFDYLTTYARVVAAYPESFGVNPLLMVEEAEQLLEYLRTLPDCPEQHRKSAEGHTERLRQTRNYLTRPVAR